MIYNYGYTPCLNFHRISNETTDIFYGFELEMIGRNYSYCANELTNKDIEHKLYWITKDCSIGAYGFEFKNQPMTFNYIKRTNVIKNIFKLINEFEMFVDSSCGLHFHINKDGLTCESIKSMDYLINMKKHIFERYCGRCYNRYCRPRRKSMDMWGQSYFSEHSDALNLTNRFTVELRIFSGTVDYNVFIERLTLTKNLVKMCNENKFEKIIKMDDKTIYKKLGLKYEY